MSLKQQFDNIFVAASEIVSEIPADITQMGYGCYMCVQTSKRTLFETLKDENTTWLNHYNPFTCEVMSMLPAMQGEGFVIDDADPSKNPEENAGCNPAQTDWLNTFILNRNHDTRPLRPGIAGVYHLYPFLDIPTLTREQLLDPATKTRWENQMAQQLKYYTDPEYWITVEVVGMSEQPGGEIIRNFHGRILEEDMAELDISKFEYEPANEPSEFYPQTPSKCLITQVDLGKFTGCSDEEEVLCRTELDEDAVKLKGNSTIYMSINTETGYSTEEIAKKGLDNIRLYGWSAIATNLMPMSMAIMDSETSGQLPLDFYDPAILDNVDPNARFMAFHTAMRKPTGACVAKPGKIEVNAL